MKTLYLLRHAQSDMGFNQKDFDRPLTEHGYAQAKEIAKYFSDIDMALSSSAVRTRETLETIIEVGTTPNKIKFTHDLYNAEAQTIFEEIGRINAQSLLIVAHNPGIHLTAYDLMEPENSSKHDMVSSLYPPCSLSIFECPIDDWALIEKKKNRLVDFIKV